MDAPRTVLRAVVEWVVAAALLAACLAVGSVAAREFRGVSAVTPVSAHDAPVPTASVPEGAVSVPVLLLPDTLEIRVGDETGAVMRLPGLKELATPTAERGRNGERLTRVLEFAGARFVLVIEPFERDAEPRIAAIYLP